MNSLFRHPKKYLMAQQVLVITIAWVFISMMITLYETAVYDYVTEATYINKAPDQSLFEHIMYSLVISVFGSFLGAFILVVVIADRFNHASYGRMIFWYSLIYILFIVFLSMIVGFTYTSSTLQKPIFDLVVIDKVIDYFTSFNLIKVVITWYLVTAFTMFLLQVNKKYGPWMLYRFVIGKYHQPRTEQRIFMFLDLKSSTTIAEKIGHHAYFKLLQQLYAIITDPILNNKGEIYQYVGDEVVISWIEKEGINNARCITCFYDIQHAVNQHLIEFSEYYDFIPSFKAGIHLGQVTAGEVGIIKKDIVYTGDVLNTTARIVNECRERQVDLIISEELKARFSPDLPYRFSELGKVHLRGKQKDVRLYGVEKV